MRRFNSGILIDPVPGAHFNYLPAEQALLAKAGAIREICDKHDVPLAAAAIQFPLAHPCVCTVLAGPRTIGELETARRTGTPFVLCVFNNAASGYVKALQHSMFGKGNYQSSDLVEMDYAAITRAMGCKGIRVDDPEKLSSALKEGLENTSTPTVLDIVVTRDPAKMLPGVDNRTLVVTKGDRPV